jgi:hypothetical protein
MASGLRFIRKGGRVIPIAAKALPAARGAKLAGHTVKGTAGGVVNRKIKAPVPPVKVNRGLDLAGLGLSVASGVLGAATFSSGVKGFVGGAIGGHAIDAAGIAANLGSVAGKGRLKDRATQAAKQEGRNLVIGNAVFAAGVLGSSKNRATLAGMAKGAAAGAAKVLAVSRKVLRLA